MQTIKNEIFQVNISELGAEIEDLYVNGINIIRERDNEWGKKAPNLFPIVGRLIDGKYFYNDKEYHMSPHGFISKMNFEVIFKSDTKIIFYVKANEDTFQIYPFKFGYYLTYELVNRQLIITVNVINEDDKEMYFAAGFHPGFRYAGLNSLVGDDIILTFDQENHQQVFFNPAFVCAFKDVKRKEISLKDLSMLLTVDDTLCFDNINKITLKGSKRELNLETEFKYLAFWQKNPNNPSFICIEPWDGLPDKIDCNQKLQNKFEIIKLNSKDTYKKSLIISI